MSDQNADPPRDEGGGAEPANRAPPKLTRWQEFIRTLFKVLGPAQTGLPPYATPEEREAHRRANLPLPAHKSEAPPGYEIRSYTDDAGILHRSFVPVAAREQTQPPGLGDPTQRAQDDPSAPESR